MRVRDAAPSDATWIVALNAASEPHVGPMDAAQYEALASQARAVRIAEADDGRPLGVSMLISPGEDYGSENYRWFADRSGDFLYVDRIMVDAAIHRSGAGRALYDDALAIAERVGAAELVAEVNETPPNPVSMAFHDSFGFETLCVRPLADGVKRVAMLARPIRVSA